MFQPTLKHELFLEVISILKIPNNKSNRNKADRLFFRHNMSITKTHRSQFYTQQDVDTLCNSWNEPPKRKSGLLRQTYQTLYGNDFSKFNNARMAYYEYKKLIKTNKPIPNYIQRYMAFITKYEQVKNS